VGFTLGDEKKDLDTQNIKGVTINAEHASNIQLKLAKINPPALIILVRHHVANPTTTAIIKQFP